jgi:DNA polymerase V
MNRTYIAIDLKSFYASVECIERGLDPLTALLVVADESRTDKTICLAVSPALKAYGIPGRARLWEVRQKAKNIDFIITPPRMALYLEYSNRIMEVYQKYVAPEDIHKYSVDEVFMDITNYKLLHKLTPRQLTTRILLDVLHTTGITGTAGIGNNLYLAKVAMDILAKHTEPDEHNVRIAELNENDYRHQL